MRSVVLALGSNIGDSAALLQGALDGLSRIDGLELDAVSGAYETDPVGGPEQRAYLNAVALGRTSLDDRGLLAACQQVEADGRRTREVRWGPRTIDIDVIAIADETSDDPDLTIPHPRAHERAFVLMPWLEIDPDATIPGHGRADDLLDHIGSDGVRRTPLKLLVGTRVPGRQS